IVDCTTKGVLLPASHPLARQSSITLADLRNLTWLHSSPQRWPGFFRTIDEALRDRGLVPLRRRERPKETPSANVQIAAGEAWALASEEIGARYRAAPTAIVYRDRKSTRLNSSHLVISYAVFCLKKKKKK